MRTTLASQSGTHRHARLLEGPLRPIAAPAYHALVALELGTYRAFSSMSPRPAPTALTAVIRTFERPKALRRLVGSIRRAYPELPLVVVDDSRDPSRLAGIETINLPFDSGVSAGRAAGLAAVSTPYVLMLDDDYIFTRSTRIELAIATLDEHPGIDLVAGRVIDLPLFRSPDRSGRLWPTRARPLAPIGSLMGCLPVVDKPANCYVARTERLATVGWDERLRRLDHADFFTRALGRLITVQDHRWSVLHAKTPFNREYMAHRNDITADVSYLRRKWPEDGSGPKNVGYVGQELATEP